MNDILLLTVDSLRADRLGYHGYERETTPNLDALAERAVTFRAAHSQGPTTFSSFPSLLTGEHAYESPDYPSLSGTTIAEQLRDAGYHTMSVTSNAWISPAYGYDEGFDEVHALGRGPLSATGLWERTRHRIGDAIEGTPLYSVLKRGYDAAREVGTQTEEDRIHELVVDHVDRSEPTFTWAHYMTTHTPYETDPKAGPSFVSEGEVPSEERHREMLEEVREGPSAVSASTRELFSDLYDESVRHVDRRIGELVSALPEETVVLVTADHGEELWEHGSFEHPPRLYQELLHVPLLVRQPDREPATIREPVSLAEVPATLSDVAGTGFPTGESVLERTRTGEFPEHVTAAVAHETRFSPETIRPDHLQVAVRSGCWKLVHRPSEDTAALYDLGDDPGETEDLAAGSEHVESLRRHAESFASDFEFEGQASVPEGLEDQLQDLGYME